jgi:hypothetical protein
MKSETGITTNGNLQKTIFIVFLLFSIHFWGLKYIPQKLNVENMLTWMFCGYCLVMVFQKNTLHFKYAILFFLAGLAANTIPAYLNFRQSPIKTFLSFEFYFFILMYFLLHYLQIGRKYLENVIIVFGIIYSVFFAVQYLIYPTLIFKNQPSTAVEEIQLEIMGHGFLMLAYFLVLNRYLVNRRMINLFMSIGFFGVLVFCGFRSLVAGAVLVSAIMIFRIFRFSVKDFAIITFAVLFFIGLLQLKIVSDTIDKMIHKSESDVKLGKKYVRLIEMEFFFKKYPRDISYFILGGGKPSGANLWRYNPQAAMGLNYNIVWVDIGLLGFYIVIGGIATFGLLWYTLKAVFFKLPKDRFYLSSYFLYLFIVSFTNEEIYRNGIFVVHAIGLYLIDLAANEKSGSGDELALSETQIAAELK